MSAVLTVSHTENSPVSGASLKKKSIGKCQTLKGKLNLISENHQFGQFARYDLRSYPTERCEVTGSREIH